MRFEKSAIVLLFALLYLTSCSVFDDDEYEVIARYDEFGVQYSPVTLHGRVNYLTPLKPVSVRVVNVDYELNPLDSFDVSIEDTQRSSNAFTISAKPVKSPILKFVTEFSYGKNSKKKISQYYRIQSTNYDISQNLNMALVAGRVEYLVQEKGLDFTTAYDSAFNAVAKIFSLSPYSTKTPEYKFDYPDFNLLLPYVLCKHEISDSVFFSEFDKLRKDFAEKGFVDSAIIVSAADAWLATFKNVSTKYVNRTEFVSVSRDSAVGLGEMDTQFFENAYGIKLVTPRYSSHSDSVKIEKESSSFYGKYFIYEEQDNGSKWRLVNPIEDTLGLCRFSTKSFVEYKGDDYLCKSGSNIWKKNVSHDELLNGYYGECGSTYKQHGDVVYARDSMFVCECKFTECVWNDKYAGKEVSEKDTAVYSMSIDARASQEFGRCYSDEYGSRKKLDSLYIQCIQRKWVQVDSLTYHMGHCASNNSKGEYLGVYYGCLVFADFGAGDTVWAEIPEFVYNGVVCNASSVKKVEKDKNDYFICDSKKVEGSNNAEYKWRKLDSAEAIPPVINMDTCGVNQYNMKKAYDGEFYMCFIGGWSHVKKESLLPIEQAGFLCSIKDYGLVKGYQGAYYICNTSNQWIELNANSAAPYKYKDSLGTCDTISHKTIVWNEEAGAFYSCQTVDKKYTWSTAPMSASPNDSIPSYLDKRKFAGGVVDGDSVYTVTVDGNKYTFRRYNSNIYKWVLDNVEISGTVYDASFYKDNLFIRGKRGAENVQLNLIENKSASFDAFYEDWKTRATGYSECGTQKAEVKDASVLAYHFNDNSYMDFAHASQFCPKGFRLLKAEEFTNSIIDITYSALGSQSVWTYEMDSGENCSGGNLVSNYFWTSDETDSETQKCYEDDRINTPAGSKSKKSIVDCPKDLYPMVQALCIKER